MKQKQENLIKENQKLKRQLAEMKASTLLSHHLAQNDLANLKQANLFGSGCLVEITKIGGGSLICPVLIQNGISDATISALQNDIKASADFVKMLT